MKKSNRPLSSSRVKYFVPRIYQPKKPIRNFILGGEVCNDALEYGNIFLISAMPKRLERYMPSGLIPYGNAFGFHARKVNTKKTTTNDCVGGERISVSFSDTTGAIDVVKTQHQRLLTSLKR